MMVSPAIEPAPTATNSISDFIVFSHLSRSAERCHELAEISRPLFLPLLLPDEECMERPLAVMRRGVGALLLQTFPLGRIVQVLPTLARGG